MKIACLLDDGFEDSEFDEPSRALRNAGHSVAVIGFNPGASVTGYRGRVRQTVERALDDADPGQYDALFLPGGISPDHLRADQRAVDFVRAMADADRPILAICHGPQLLLTAGLVRGRTMTAWSTVQGDLRFAGADVVDRPVVVDGRWVTSRQPDDIPAFVDESLTLLAQTSAAVGV